MRNIFEDLYFGNIVPCEKRTAAGSELRHPVNRAADWEARLAERLNDGEKQILDTLISTQHEIDSTMARESFILGFRLGIGLMTGCMDEDDGELTDRGETMAKRRANGEERIRKRKDGHWEERCAAGWDTQRPETSS